MPIFRIISLTTGIALTTATIYTAQKVIKTQCQQDNVSASTTLGARIAVSFLTSIILGGAVNKVINTTFS